MNQNVSVHRIGHEGNFGISPFLQNHHICWLPVRDPRFSLSDTHPHSGVRQMGLSRLYRGGNGSRGCCAQGCTDNEWVERGVWTRVAPTSPIHPWNHSTASEGPSSWSPPQIQRTTVLLPLSPPLSFLSSSTSFSPSRLLGKIEMIPLPQWTIMKIKWVNIY